MTAEQRESYMLSVSQLKCGFGVKGHADVVSAQRIANWVPSPMHNCPNHGLLNSFIWPLKQTYGAVLLW
jgi:hypothetical protein